MSYSSEAQEGQIKVDYLMRLMEINIEMITMYISTIAMTKFKPQIDSYIGRISV